MIPITPPALPGGGNFPLEVVVTATDDTQAILQLVETLKEKGMAEGLFAFPPIIDTKIDQPHAKLIIDRDKVADLGLTLQQVGNDVAVMLSGNFVNRFNIQGRSYRVIPQVKRTGRLNPEQLRDLYITGPNHQLIKLGTVATVENSVVPRSLNRFQQQNAVKLSGVSTKPLGEALLTIENLARQLMPSTYSIDYIGESRQLRREGDKFLPAFMLAVVLIFMALAVQFSSFRDPLVIILGSIPLAMFGALIFIFLKMPNPQLPFWTDGWTTSLNIYSQVGLVTLMGLIAKNGILMVEFANTLQEQGLQKLAAVRQAAVTRLRPILMTSVATVAGHFPLILVVGAGAEARNSIGIVLVSGMSIGTLFTLFVIPSIYMLLAKDRKGTRTTL
jgi:multidrug efflux pump